MVKSHFTGIQSAILEELKQARFSIKVAVAWFTSDPLFEALCRRAEEGLDVQLILSNSINDYDKGDYYARRLNASGGELFRHGASDFKDGGVMHHKFAVIDEKTVITGSFNWTNQGSRNAENIVIINELKQAQVYLQQFQKLKLGSTYRDHAEDEELTVSFTASKAVVSTGDTVQLHWSAIGADEVNIDWGGVRFRVEPNGGTFDTEVEEDKYGILEARYDETKIRRSVKVRVAKTPIISSVLEYKDPIAGYYKALLPTAPLKDVYTVPEGLIVRLTLECSNTELLYLNGESIEPSEQHIFLPTEQTKEFYIRAIGIKEEANLRFVLRVLKVPMLKSVKSVLPGDIQLQVKCSYEKVAIPSRLRLHAFGELEARSVKIDHLKSNIVSSKMTRTSVSENQNLHFEQLLKKSKRSLQQHLKTALGNTLSKSKTLSNLLKQYD